MPSFEIYYREQDGTLVEKFSVHCASPMHAKVMAHAMKASPAAEIEVWLGDALVYERPHRAIFEQARNLRRLSDAFHAARENRSAMLGIFIFRAHIKAAIRLQ